MDVREFFWTHFSKLELCEENLKITRYIVIKVHADINKFCIDPSNLGYL